jgi:hypothetical protein
VKKALSRIERERGILVAIKFELATSNTSILHQFLPISNLFSLIGRAHIMTLSAGCPETILREKWRDFDQFCHVDFV